MTAPTGPRRILVLLALVAGLGMALTVGWALPAAAHAELMTTDPAHDAVLDLAPSEITLVFSEAVTIADDGLRILGGDGERVDAGAAAADGDTVSAGVDGTIDDGSYLVAWRVISADGHPVRGAFTFSVGESSALAGDLADEAFTGSADTRDEAAGWLLRSVTYLAVLGAAGAVVVGAGLRRAADGPPVGRPVSVAALVGLGALVAQLPVQASLATGRGWGSITDPGVLQQTLADGVGWSVALVGAGLLCVLVTAGLTFTHAVRALAVGGSVVAPPGLALAGHTRTMDPAWLGYGADVVHVWAGAVWFGGLAVLVPLVRRRRAAGDVAGAVEAVARFSGWAALALAAVAASGTALGWLTVGGPGPLTGTGYGRLLLVKVALVGIVIALGAWNRYRLVPALSRPGADPSPPPGSAGGGARDAAMSTAGPFDPDRSGEAPSTTGGAVAVVDGTSHLDHGVDQDVDRGIDRRVDRGDHGGVDRDAAHHQERSWSQLLRTVRLEVALLAVVVAVTGVLVNETPARVLATPELVTLSAPLGEGTVEVVVDPATAGRNDVHAYLLGPDGGLDDRYDDAGFELSLPALGVGPLDLEPVRAGPGHFQVVGTDLDLAGQWDLTIRVRPDRFTEQVATLTFEVR